jgi:hypothetical protein
MHRNMCRHRPQPLATAALGTHDHHAGILSETEQRRRGTTVPEAR